MYIKTNGLFVYEVYVANVMKSMADLGFVKRGGGGGVMTNRPAWGRVKGEGLVP